ncbi:alpha/beta fold hydrolase [Streptomyces sp. NPDC001219]
MSGPSHRLRRASAMALGAAGLGAAAVGVRAFRHANTVVPRPGEQVLLSEGPVHALWRRAENGPTVVFENALLCALSEWLWVTDALDESVPFLAYDRPGTGWTPRLRRGLQPEAYADRLWELLQLLNLPAPYVLVGHSVGGILVRSFALRHPEVVAGLVLVDSSHPDQLARSRIQREALPGFRQGVTLGCVRAATGRMYDAMALSHVCGLPGETKEMTRRQLSLPGPWYGAREEVRWWLRAWNDDARQLSGLPGKRVAVVTAGRSVRQDPVHGELQRELAGLSSEHRHETVPDAEHEALVMEPGHARTVAEAVAWVRAGHRPA